MKVYSNLSDRLTLKADRQGNDGRWGSTHEEFLRLVNGVIGRVTDGLSSDEFSDTVFTYDAWEGESHPVDTADEILSNDTLGQQFLELFLNPGGES